MIDVAYYLFNAFGISTKPCRLMLTKWVNVSKERFNEILSTVTEAQNNGLRTNVDGREIILINAETLLKDTSNRKINKREFIKKYNNIADDVEVLNKSILTRNHLKIIKIFSLLREIIVGSSYEQPDTTYMPELESEDSATQRKEQNAEGLKILIPN